MNPVIGNQASYIINSPALGGIPPPQAHGAPAAKPRAPATQASPVALTRRTYLYHSSLLFHKHLFIWFSTTKYFLISVLIPGIFLYLLSYSNILILSNKYFIIILIYSH